MAAADAAVSTQGKEEGYGGIAVEGPVLVMMSKRLRALRKKVSRISQIEDSKASGKNINKEQEEVLKSKPSVMTLIDEYERLRGPLTVSVQEEHVEQERSRQLSLKQTEEDAARVAAEGEVVEETDAVYSGNFEGSSGAGEGADRGGVEKLVQLLFFGSLFDLQSVPLNGFPGESTDAAETGGGRATPSMLSLWAKSQERGSCFSHVADPSLSAVDLDALATLSRYITGRSGAGTTHKEALHVSVGHAEKWLVRSEEEVAGTPLTYAQLRSCLEKIVGSVYYTNPPINAESAATGGTTGQYSDEPQSQIEEPIQALESLQEAGLPMVQDQQLGVAPETKFVPDGGFTIGQAYPSATRDSSYQESAVAVGGTEYTPVPQPFPQPPISLQGGMGGRPGYQPPMRGGGGRVQGNNGGRGYFPNRGRGPRGGGGQRGGGASGFPGGGHPDNQQHGRGFQAGGYMGRGRGGRGGVRGGGAVPMQQQQQNQLQTDVAV